MCFCTFPCRINNKKTCTFLPFFVRIAFEKIRWPLFFPPHIHRRQQMVCYAVIYRCIAGGAVLFHKYFCCWIIDGILSAGSATFHSLSMEWKIWCKLRLTLKPFRLLLVFFSFYSNCQGISQHLFQCTIRGISYSWLFYGGTFERDVVLQLPVKLEVFRLVELMLMDPVEGIVWNCGWI